MKRFTVTSDDVLVIHCDPELNPGITLGAQGQFFKVTDLAIAAFLLKERGSW